MAHNEKLQAARAAFTALLNALDEAREDVAEDAEDIIDGLMAVVEAQCRVFDAAFSGEERER